MRPVLTHLALHVRDLDTTIAFYRDYCGMQVVHERVTDGRRVVWLAEPGREQEFIFVLVPGGQGQPQAATAEKGEYLFATYAAAVGKLVEEVIAWDGKSWEMP